MIVVLPHARNNLKPQLSETVCTNIIGTLHVVVFFMDSTADQNSTAHKTMGVQLIKAIC